MVLQPIRRLSLSGCGWLFPFHVGVISSLQAHGVIGESTVLTGVSGGALVATGHASGLSENDMMDIATDIIERWSIRGGGSLFDVWGQMGPIVEVAMHRALPSDAHLRCNGKVSLGVTPVAATSSIWHDHPIMFGHHGAEREKDDNDDLIFRSKNDLIQCCLCSSHIPYYMDNHFSKEWRGKQWLDGGMVDILAPVPNKDIEHCIQSMPYHIMAAVRRRKNEHELPIITPLQSEFQLLRELLPWTFVPSQNLENFQRLRDAGFSSAERFISEQQKNGRLQ